MRPVSIDDAGSRVKRPSSYNPTSHRPRKGYASGFGQNPWLSAEDSVVECIDDFERCLADETGELAKHYNYNDIFFSSEERPVTLCVMWWADHGSPGSQRTDVAPNGRLIDVSITAGVVDRFIVGDFVNSGITGPLSGNGRYIHGRCDDPRPTDEVDIVIENNRQGPAPHDGSDGRWYLLALRSPNGCILRSKAMRVPTAG